MENYTLEQLDQLNTMKLLMYLEMNPITKSANNPMMNYEQRLAAEKDLFVCMRRINYLLDIIISE